MANPAEPLGPAGSVPVACSHAAVGDTTMPPHPFDTLTKQLQDGSRSRRRALHAVAGTIAGLALPALAPQTAEASRAQRKCAKKGSTWLTTADATSPCHCAFTCSSKDQYYQPHCQSNSACYCFETTEGEGFCMAGGSASKYSCASSTECTSPAKCIIFPDPFVGCGTHSCASNANCLINGIQYACVNGTCQFTVCATPCACLGGGCTCVPQCQGKICGDDGCGGSCGTCPLHAFCSRDGSHCICDFVTCAGTCCAEHQVCYQNACCTKRPEPSCHTVAVSDGCGGTYPANCSLNCCENTQGVLVCQTAPCR
jgi:hypothetical protein